jgi:hypothetical protein
MIWKDVEAVISCLKILSHNFQGETTENCKKPYHANWSSDKNSSPRPPKYNAGMSLNCNIQ